MYIVTIQKHHRLQYLLDDSKKDIQIILLECEAETLGPAAKEASPFTLTFMPLSHNYKLSKSIRCMTYLSEASKWSSRMSGVSFRHSLSCTWRESLPGRAWHPHWRCYLQSMSDSQSDACVRTTGHADLTSNRPLAASTNFHAVEKRNQTGHSVYLSMVQGSAMQACCTLPSCSQSARCSQAWPTPT